MMTTLKETVNEALDNAVENGYLDELLGRSARATAEELCDQALDEEDMEAEPGGGLERFISETLTPIVQAWLDAKKKVS